MLYRMPQYEQYHRLVVELIFPSEVASDRHYDGVPSFGPKKGP